MGRKSRRAILNKAISKKGISKSLEKRKSDGSSTPFIANPSGDLPTRAESVINQVSRTLSSQATINVKLKLARLTKKNIKQRRQKVAKKMVKLLHGAKKKKESFQQQRSTAIIRRAKKVNPKAWNQLTKEEKCRRLRKIERIAPGATISSAAEESVMTAESSLAMAVMNNLTTRQVAGVRRYTNNLVASNYAINKAKKEILNAYGSQIEVSTSSNCAIKTFTFDQTFMKFLESKDPEHLSSLQTVVFSADGGGDTVTVTKAGWYPCNVINPCSEKSFRILSSFEEKECYEYLKAVLEVALRSLTKWKNGCFFNYLFIRVIAIITGDLKFLNSYNGLQGCQAMYCCPICLVRKNDLVRRIRDAPLRTLAQLHDDYDKLQELLKSATTTKTIAKAHQECHSVKNEPMTDYFEVSHMCPGVCHTLAGALNAICGWAKKINKEKIEKLFKDAAVFPQGHTKKLTGNHGRIVLNKLSNGDITYDGEGLTLLLLLADIQQYAIAEILTDEKIAEFLQCIEAFANEVSKEKYDEIAKSSQHIHMIIAHVGPFVVLHRSWGLYSDQPGEAIHKTQNRYYERIPKRSSNINSAKKAVNQNEFFVGNTILQNKFNDKK